MKEYCCNLALIALFTGYLLSGALYNQYQFNLKFIFNWQEHTAKSGICNFSRAFPSVAL
jgi:hypothetical protein